MHQHNSFLKQRWTGACLSLFVTSAVFLAAIPVQSQDKKQTKSADDDVIKVTSNLVSLDVIVKDKKGKAVTDLNREDFTVTENGVPQKIEFFDSTLTTNNNNEATQTATSTVPTETRPRIPTGFPRNIIALVLDGQSTEAANLKHVREGMMKYIRERITNNDSVALFSISAGLQLLQPFTQDKAKLIAAVEKAYDSSTVSKTSEARGLSEDIRAMRDSIASGPELTGGTAPSQGFNGSAAAQALISRHVLEQYIALRSTLSAQQTRPVLAALAAISEGLRSIPGKKTLVMFSQGFIASETLDWQVQSTIDIANRANVAIYIIDSGGLTGGAPTSGALVSGSPLGGISGGLEMEQRRRAGAGESVFDITRQEGLNRQQDLLYRISEDTGGHFIKNTNDIAGGLERIDAEIRSRYTLAYRSTNPNFDGSFRKVKIEVRRPDTNVLTRPGYYAIPPSQIVPFSPDDRKLLANFANMQAHPTLPLSLQLNSFRAREGFYIVPLSFEIPPAAVQFDRKGDKQRLQLEVLGVIRAEGEDKILSRLGGDFDVALSAQQYESILNDKIFYRQDMQLYAGNYTVDLIVRDRLSGKVAAKQEKLVLPLDRSDFWVTEAVLSRHAEPVKQTARNGDVFTEGNVQIRPSPSREFHSTDNLIIFFKLYNAAVARETGKPLVRVTVTLMKDGRQAVRPLDYQLTEPAAEPVLHLTFAKYIKLTGLPPGKYSALIESRDIVQQKVVKQEAGFVIVP
ncbi:MAG TPA: VWA domain-containing protein [Pyrinomonadaceae bacterium]|nr:VWA domain-containing protein [Pyrinomonadaceae bacterium]